MSNIEQTLSIIKPDAVERSNKNIYKKNSINFHLLKLFILNL